MMKNAILISTVLIWFITGCGAMQSMVKSSFPYTTTLSIPPSTQIGDNHSAVGPASSFDQNFFKNANYVNAVKIVSAELRSSTPADFDLGSIKSVKIYLSKGDDSNAILVASQNNIPLDAGNTITLTVDNSNFLDRFIREPDVKIKMLYQLRKQVGTETSLMVVLNISAYPVGNK